MRMELKDKHPFNKPEYCSMLLSLFYSGNQDYMASIKGWVFIPMYIDYEYLQEFLDD